MNREWVGGDLRAPPGRVVQVLGPAPLAVTIDADKLGFEVLKVGQLVVAECPHYTHSQDSVNLWVDYQL